MSNTFKGHYYISTNKCKMLTKWSDYMIYYLFVICYIFQKATFGKYMSLIQRRERN